MSNLSIRHQIPMQFTLLTVMAKRIEGTNSANLYTQQQVVDQMCIFSEVV